MDYAGGLVGAPNSFRAIVTSDLDGLGELSDNLTATSITESDNPVTMSGEWLARFERRLPVVADDARAVREVDFLQVVVKFGKSHGGKPFVESVVERTPTEPL